MPKPMTALLGALVLLAAASSVLLVWVLTRPAPQLPRPAAANPDAPEALSSLNYIGESIGLPADAHPAITHVAITDLDGDGLLDVIVCDAAANRIGWIRQAPRGVFAETFIGDDVPTPSHVAVGDLNQDGKVDLVVASLGQLSSTDDRVGSIVVMENLGEGRFATKVVAEHLLPVSDVRTLEINGDGRVDLVASERGRNAGAVAWWENRGDGQFREHPIDASGPVVTLAAREGSGAGKAIVAALVGGETETVKSFRSDGAGLIPGGPAWSAPGPDWDGAALDFVDLARDGSIGLVMANGGTWDDFPGPESWHGLGWLEARAGKYEYHSIGDMPGCCSPACADLNGDGRTDIVAVSSANDPLEPAAVWMTAWLNDGHGHFVAAPLTHDIQRLTALAVGDLDGNRVPVLVTGGWFTYAPPFRPGRITLWRQH